MTTIHLITHIHASPEAVFNLSRSIDFHVKSAKTTKEKAVAGITSGYIGLNETVTWRGKHFGIYLTHQSLITEYEYANRFTDEMIRGCFKSFKHHHIFIKTIHGTEMVDILDYKVPYGIFGKIFNKLLLKKHLTYFLRNRNNLIKSNLENS